MSEPARRRPRSAPAPATARFAPAASLAVGLPALGCASPTPPTDASTVIVAGPEVSSGTEAEAYFPLVEGHIHQFRTTRFGEDPEPEEGLLVLRASRSSATEGSLRGPAGERRIFFRPDGVESQRPDGRRGYMLKLPFDTGASWPGEHGGTTRVVAADLRVTVAAGSYEGCVQTLEERGGDAPLRITTTYCRGVGITALEAASGPVVERAELGYFGPPIDLGPDGARRLE